MSKMDNTMKRRGMGGAARNLLRGLVVWFALAAGLAHAALTIEIVGTGANQIPVAIVPFAGENSLPQSITAVVAADLQRSGLFRMVDSTGIQPLPSEPADVNYPVWRGRGAEALAIGG